jgi:CDP-diacylglycerol--serine O-phosphatidyltransferase
MLRGRRRMRRALPVNSLIPNILTVLALCAGMTAIRFGLQERWDLAVFAIVVAGVFDGLDGRLARLLKGATKFGAELDSLSDFIAFGVAPAVLVYLWTTHLLGGFGWVAALAFGTCCALRLARFNTAIGTEHEAPAWHRYFFTGVAAPAGAGFAVLPIILSHQFGDTFFRNPFVCAIWLMLVAFLMISRIPTYSFKLLRVRRDFVLPTLVLVGFLAAVLVSYPWFTLGLVGIAYLASIPFSIQRHRRLTAGAKLAAAPAPEPAAEESDAH